MHLTDSVKLDSVLFHNIYEERRKYEGSPVTMHDEGLSENLALHGIFCFI